MPRRFVSPGGLALQPHARDQSGIAHVEPMLLRIDSWPEAGGRLSQVARAASRPRS